MPVTFLVLHHQPTLLNTEEMPEANTVFLCPAYRPHSAEQAALFVNKCDIVARRFKLQHRVLHNSLTCTGAGDWHRNITQDEAYNMFLYKYLWPIRGGFGCINWIDLLLGRDCDSAPCLIGYSDITVWHCIWHVRGWGESHYAFMPGTNWGTVAEESLERCLNGSSWAINDGDYPDVQVVRPGNANGPCFAACLSVLASVAGTAAQPDLRGHVLALEDIDERPYMIERSMQQLYHAGMLEGIAGLVIGTMPHEEIDNYGGPSIIDLFERWGEQLHIPLIQALPFGHVKDPLSLPVGRMSTLSVTDTDWSWSFAAR